VFVHYSSETGFFQKMTIVFSRVIFFVVSRGFGIVSQRRFSCPIFSREDACGI
jgi:hypothetical protein